jgi:hypothetical protein
MALGFPRAETFQAGGLRRALGALLIYLGLMPTA